MNFQLYFRYRWVERPSSKVAGGRLPFREGVTHRLAQGTLGEKTGTGLGRIQLQNPTVDRCQDGWSLRCLRDLRVGASG